MNMSTKNVFFTLLGALCLGQCQAQKPTMNRVTHNGMSVSWRIDQTHIYFELEASTEGWIAIGFNKKDQLAGTNLIMIAVQKERAILSDRYILAPGDHREIAMLGGEVQAQLLEAWEHQGLTRAIFSLPLKLNDHWRFPLSAGQSLHLLLAYSQEDDFMHHSMMRTSALITI
jgi:DOMON domain